jgi:hypothetical protein
VYRIEEGEGGEASGEPRVLPEIVLHPLGLGEGGRRWRGIHIAEVVGVVVVLVRGGSGEITGGLEALGGGGVMLRRERVGREGGPILARAFVRQQLSF